ncbi:MFS transporter [Luteimonas deserti]|uniref:MFS transporter n=1 Tax=Luteimonas deserti TaxID=2752306 RepID=A0A7Z0U170_9GAMM|nr:MFS transporter [Luteimonas deserti]NYZ64043.1 MFS transporter [Luteimonas deserti]
MTPAPARPRPYAAVVRILVLLGIALSAFNLRTAVTSLTPLLDLLGRSFGFGSTTAGVLGMLPTAAFAVFGVVTPALARRIGIERTALLAMALAAAGLVLRACAGGVGVLMLGSIVALAGMGIGNVVLPPLVKRYFPARIGAVSTLYITVLQLGTMLPALAAVPLATAAGWRVALGAWALTAVAAALPWIGLLLLARRPASGLELQVPAPVLADASAAGRAWRSPLAWGMALMFGTTSLVTYAMFTWLPALFTGAGASPAFGGSMVALFAALGLVGALGVPSMAVRLRNPFGLVLLCAGCNALAFTGLLLAPLAAPVLWVTLLGLGASTFPLSLTLINLRTRTPVGSAALSGFMQGVGYAFSCAGPLLFGILHGRTGSWHWPFAMLYGFIAVLLLGGWLACRPRALEDSWRPLHGPQR